jgi:hypothetical protein
MLLYCFNWFGALIKGELRHRRSVLEIKESLGISVDVDKRRNRSQKDSLETEQQTTLTN